MTEALVFIARTDAIMWHQMPFLVDVAEVFGGIAWAIINDRKTRK
jgi:hypothetical protein